MTLVLLLLLSVSLSVVVAGDGCARDHIIGKHRHKLSLVLMAGVYVVATQNFDLYSGLEFPMGMLVLLLLKQDATRHK